MSGSQMDSKGGYDTADAGGYMPQSESSRQKPPSQHQTEPPPDVIKSSPIDDKEFNASEYKVCPKIGKAVIVSNFMEDYKPMNNGKNKPKDPACRDYASEDCKNLERVLGSLGFEPLTNEEMVHKNLTKSQFTKLYKKAAQEENYRTQSGGYTCVLFIVMSYGRSGLIKCHAEKAGGNHEFAEQKDLQEAFQPQNNHSLALKPKIFIVQIMFEFGSSLMVCTELWSLDLNISRIEVSDQEQQGLYPTEFLNTLTPSGTPPHKLYLKKGVPIILLRNINPTEGLLNGTRMCVRNLGDHIIEAEVLTGQHTGNIAFLPRITIIPSDAGLPFNLKRRQFPTIPEETDIADGDLDKHGEVKTTTKRIPREADFLTYSSDSYCLDLRRPYSVIKDVVAQLCDVLVEIHMDFPKVLLLPIQGLPLSAENQSETNNFVRAIVDTLEGQVKDMKDRKQALEIQRLLIRMNNNFKKQRRAEWKIPCVTSSLTKQLKLF